MSIRDNLIRNSKFIGYDRENSISIKSYVGNDNPFTVPCDGIINVMARADLNNRFAVRVFIKDNAESEATYSMGTVVSTPDMQTWGREIFEVFKGQQFVITEDSEGDLASAVFTPYKTSYENSGGSNENFAIAYKQIEKNTSDIKNLSQKIYGLNKVIETNSIIMTSPNGTRYVITVNNDGNLSTSIEDTETVASGTYDDSGTLVRTWSEIMSAWNANYTGDLDIDIASTSFSPPECITTLGGFTDSETILVIDNSIETIGNFMFFGNNGFGMGFSFKEIILPKKLKYIYDNAFASQTLITSITLPDTIVDIGANSFGSCQNLTEINVPWAEGAVANAPWGASNATINYNYEEKQT